MFKKLSSGSPQKLKLKVDKLGFWHNRVIKSPPPKKKNENLDYLIIKRPQPPYKLGHGINTHFNKWEKKIPKQ